MVRLTRKRTDFSGAWVLNPDKATDRKSIIITGCARGGTSFAASAFLRLGIPFGRKNAQGREASKRTHEHFDLRDHFMDGDEAKLKAVADEFASQYDVWAWKLPGVLHSLDLARRSVVNPHFVFIFKEPVSIGLRRVDIKGADFLNVITNVLSEYQTMVAFAATAQVPTMFVSYDVAMANVEAFIADAAAFAGVAHYDPEEVTANIRKDADRYYPGGRDAQAEA